MLVLPKAGDANRVSPLVRPQRLLKLVSLLESGDAVSGETLANSLGVCTRTVFRDIRLLRAANIPILFDLSHRGYCIRRNNVRNPVGTSEASAPDNAWVRDGAVCRCPKIMAEEIAALLLALRVVGPLPDNIVDACESALVKIMAAALPAARQRAVNIMEQSAETVEIPVGPHVLPLRPSG